jgi:hypothetical protein
MEYYPIISSALDLFMEEATTIGLNGKMLNIFSNNERIKSILNDFFYDTVNVNVNLPFWVRNTVKYGDNFVLLYGERKVGITHVKQMVNYEIERFERIQDGKPLVKFKQTITGDEFNTFEIAHFRLLGDDKYLPYGSSVLNKVRRVFRQLVMAEDAMLTYRIIRAGEKKVFKIDVGNIDEDDIEDYVYKVATKFKKIAQPAQNDGQIDYRFNVLGNDEDYFLPVRNANTQTGVETLDGACLVLDTKIKLLDGRDLTLNEIIDEFDSGNELWTYSINPQSGEIVPSPITWAGVTRKNTEVLRITLDNGESVTVTPDHKFPTKFNGVKEAKDLEIDESLWSFNTKESLISTKKYAKQYEMVYDHSINDWVYTHRMVGNYMKKNKIQQEHRKKCSDNTKLLWKTTNLREIVKEKQTIKYSQKLLDLLVSYYNEYNKADLILKNKINVDGSEWLTEFWSLNENNVQLKKLTKFTLNNINKMVKYFGYDNWRDFKNKIPYYNHKIQSIEWLTEKEDTGTITIDGDEQLHNYHNFALSCGVFTKNSNLDAIQDIEYLRDNLFIGLGIPKPFLSFQDAAGGGKNMAQHDIRFAKKVNRIQQAMIQELNKMAIVHLHLLGFSGEDLDNFELSLTNPSVQQEMMKSELFREKAQTYTELTRGDNGIAAMSHTQAKRMIFNQSDREIIEDLKQQKMEKVVMQELADAPVLIKKSGLFADIDDRFGDESAMEDAANNPEGGEDGGGPAGGGGMDANSPMGAPAGGGGLPDLPDLPAADGAPMSEGLTEAEFNDHLERMVSGNSTEGKRRSHSSTVEDGRKIIHENSLINSQLNNKANDMVNEIDEILKKSETINNNIKLDENKSLDIDNIENINFEDE